MTRKTAWRGFVMAWMGATLALTILSIINQAATGQLSLLHGLWGAGWCVAICQGIRDIRRSWKAKDEGEEWVRVYPRADAEKVVRQYVPIYFEDQEKAEAFARELSESIIVMHKAEGELKP
jgi:hypothetical protein